METDNNKFYYNPVPDERIIEKATSRATYLLDHMYVTLTTGYTYDQFLEDLINLELSNNNKQ